MAIKHSIQQNQKAFDVVMLDENWISGIPRNLNLLYAVQTSQDCLTGWTDGNARMAWDNLEAVLNQWKEEHGQVPSIQLGIPRGLNELAAWECAGFGVSDAVDLVLHLAVGKTYGPLQKLIDLWESPMQSLFAVLCIKFSELDNPVTALKACIWLLRASEVVRKDKLEEFALKSAMTGAMAILNMPQIKHAYSLSKKQISALSTARNNSAKARSAERKAKMNNWTNMAKAKWPRVPDWSIQQMAEWILDEVDDNMKGSISTIEKALSGVKQAVLRSSRKPLKSDS